MKEADLAISLGVPRADLRQIRDGLELETHWGRGHGGAIVYTEAGVEAVKAALGTALHDESGAEKDTPPKTSSAVEEALEAKFVASDPTEDAATTLEPTSGANTSEKNAPTKWEARVTNLFRNPRILQAQLLDSGKEIKVRVKDSKNFHRGMKIPVILESNGWARLGRKHPRWKGRW